MIYLTKSEYIFQAIKDEIIDGTLAPGSRVVVADISNRFSVSAMPIREAISKLAKYGYVDFEPHLGARVAQIDFDKLKEITMLRNEIEPLVAKLATPYISQSLMDELQSLIDRMKEKAKENDKVGYEKLNKEFHHKIYDCNPYNYIKELNDELWIKSEISKIVLTKASDRIENSIKEHELWLEAIRNHDPEEVYRIVKHHKTQAFRQLSEVMK